MVLSIFRSASARGKRNLWQSHAAYLVCSERIRSVVIIRPNLIDHYIFGRTFILNPTMPWTGGLRPYERYRDFWGMDFWLCLLPVKIYFEKPWTLVSFLPEPISLPLPNQSRCYSESGFEPSSFEFLNISMSYACNQSSILVASYTLQHYAVIEKLYYSFNVALILLFYSCRFWTVVKR